MVTGTFILSTRFPEGSLKPRFQLEDPLNSTTESTNRPTHQNTQSNNHDRCPVGVSVFLIHLASFTVENILPDNCFGLPLSVK